MLRQRPEEFLPRRNSPCDEPRAYARPGVRGAVYRRKGVGAYMEPAVLHNGGAVRGVGRNLVLFNERARRRKKPQIIADRLARRPARPPQTYGLREIQETYCDILPKPSWRGRVFCGRPSCIGIFRRILPEGNRGVPFGGGNFLWRGLCIFWADAP